MPNPTFQRTASPPLNCIVRQRMQAGISFAKVWFDDDMVELEIYISDGSSAFVTRVYVGHQQLATLVESLESFKALIHGGLRDIRLGEFGPEYAKGAFMRHFISIKRDVVICS